MLSKKLFFHLEIACVQLVKDRSDLRFKQKTFPLLTHFGKVIETKHYRQIYKSFFVTEKIKQLAGGEVTLTVHIDEDEYRNAMLDLMISGTEGNYTFNSHAIMHNPYCEMN